MRPIKLECGEVINDNKDVFHPVMEQKFDDTVYYEAFAKAAVDVFELSDVRSMDILSKEGAK